MARRGDDRGLLERGDQIRFVVRNVGTNNPGDEPIFAKRAKSKSVSSPPPKNISVFFSPKSLS
jgi:hypothetical protein